MRNEGLEILALRGYTEVNKNKKTVQKFPNQILQMVSRTYIRRDSKKKKKTENCGEACPFSS